jgi:Skp family chaperone for outer membrane proteins
VKTLLIRHRTLNRNLTIKLLAAVIVASTCLTASAQAPNAAGANAPKYGIAVVDTSYIFKNHRRFKATAEAMKKEMEGIEAGLKADREKIVALEQDRNQYAPGSPDFKKRDEEVARQNAEFQLKMNKLRQDFLERQSKVYYQTWLEISEAVKIYSQRQHIGLVLRFNGEPVDPNRREAVMQDINRPVVMQDQIDITPDILAIVNRDVPPSGGAVPGAPGAPNAAGAIPPTATRPANPSQLPPH